MCFYQINAGTLIQGSLLVKRVGAEIEMLEKIGTSYRDAGRLAVIISAMANTTGGTIYIGRIVKATGYIYQISFLYESGLKLVHSHILFILPLKSLDH